MAVGQHTTISGHSYFLSSLDAMRRSCSRSGQRMAIVMFDLDRFSDCNENVSPAFGDEILQWFSDTLSCLCLPRHLFTRYESDRLLVALPDAGYTDSDDLARRCQDRMLNHPPQLHGHPYEVTASVGITVSTIGCIEQHQELIKQARFAVDWAKQQGGNRIVHWTDIVDADPDGAQHGNRSSTHMAQWLARVREQIRSAHTEVTQALVAAVEAKDPYTRSHSLSVSVYSEALGKQMRLHPPLARALRRAALLHDVGKIGIPDAILTKPGPLTDEEFDIIKRHPQLGVDILSHVSHIKDEVPMILHHHERFDGRGYPHGLAGKRIPIGARILAMADSLDAMFSQRSYKPAYSLERVQSEIEDGAGGQFDPAVCTATQAWLQDMQQSPDTITWNASTAPV